MRQRRKRIFRGVALAFAIAAFAVPTAQARPLTKWGTNPTATAAASYTPQQLRALQLRSQGMNERYGSAAASYAPQQLRALVLGSQGMNERYGLAENTTSRVQVAAAPLLVASSSGFGWGDAFVGAGAVIATAIVLLAGVTVLKRREQPLGI